jgi:hypothetical protein
MELRDGRNERNQIDYDKFLVKIESFASPKF